MPAVVEHSPPLWSPFAFGLAPVSDLSNPKLIQRPLVGGKLRPVASPTTMNLSAAARRHHHES
jgi:hypothetical protein